MEDPGSRSPEPTTSIVLWIEPELGTQFGTTDFELSLTQVSRSGDLSVRSLLEWPVDFVLAGVQLGLSWKAPDPRRELGLSMRVHTNLGDARGTMDDSDWLSSSSEGIPPTLFAFTKSETDSFALLSELMLALRLARSREALAIDALFGYRHEYFSLSALGARGRAIDMDGEWVAINLASSIRAADYRVHHALPFTGAQLTYAPVTRFSVVLGAHLFGLYSHSVDDHVLRNKESVGNATGLGANLSLGPKFHINEHWALGTSLDLFYLKGMRGVLKQKFYADDPGTMGDDRELSVPNSNFYVESLRFQALASVRATF